MVVFGVISYATYSEIKVGVNCGKKVGRLKIVIKREDEDCARELFGHEYVCYE